MPTKPTILYIEDEDDIRDQLSKLLDRFSSELFIAKDGKVGLELFKKYSPDIIITDIKIPVMSGTEMVKKIKKINPEQHIIFTTAHNESKYLIDAIETQVEGYILKPIDFPILKQKLLQITKQIDIEKELLVHHILMNEITQMLNILVVLDKDNKIIYSNKNFLKFFRLKDIKQFNDEYQSISDTFVNYGGFFHPKDSKKWIEEITNLEDDKQVVSMINEDTEPQAFIVSIKQVNDTKHSIVIFTEITNITIKKNELEYKAYTDDLTKLANKTYFEDELKKEFIKSTKANKPLGLILFDIDDFKNINNTYGKKIGDELLIEFANLIQANISQKDIIARWGGDRFIQLLPYTSKEHTLLVLNRLKNLIQNHTFKDNISLNCSFAIANKKNYHTKENIIEELEEALFNSKKG